MKDNKANIKKHSVTDFKKAELEMILNCIVENIRLGNREMSIKEYSVIQKIKNAIGRI